MIQRLIVAIGLALTAGTAAQATPASPSSLHAVAHESYVWRDSVYPVNTSDQGNHRWDDRITEYRDPALPRTALASPSIDEEHRGWICLIKEPDACGEAKVAKESAHRNAGIAGRAK